MSKQNKIHPAHYTQRGRLTQDDAAREVARQRSIGAPHRWRPAEKTTMPGLPFKSEDAGRSAETLESTGSQEAGPFPAKERPAKRVTREAGTKAAVKKTRGQGAARAGTARTTGKAKALSAAKRVSRTTATGNKRKAVLARNVGGPALKPLRAAKRRKR